MNSEALVFLIDDDANVRTALARGLAFAGFRVRTFEDANRFLAAHDPAQPGCLVTDVAMPGMNGLELQQRLVTDGCTRPIVFISANGSIPMSVQAMRAGAVTFLPKPVRLDELAGAIQEALERDRALRAERANRAAVESRFASLTTRERQVLALVVAGKMNKQIAAALGAAEKTVRVHRGRVMNKMQVRSVAELVTLTAHTRGAAPPLPQSPLSP